MMQVNLDSLRVQQRAICDRFGVQPVDAPSDLKVGIAANVREGVLPINALRLPPEGDTTGWYIWAGGEPSADPEFFQPLHVEHLETWCPQILVYLQLPPGFRVQVAPGHEDVWEDLSLLDARP